VLGALEQLFEHPGARVARCEDVAELGPEMDECLESIDAGTGGREGQR
jgi:hypothetical protein